jgi:ferredoxin
MLKKIRIIISLLVSGLLTAYFLDFTGIIPAEIYLLGCIQFIPAFLSLNVAAIIFLLVCVMLFGRVYCSFICPMGVFQDIANRCSKSRQKTYRHNKPVLRLSVLAVNLVLFFLGLPVITGVLDPYGAYGRMAAHLFKPVYMLFNNALARVFNHYGNYTFYRVEITAVGLFSLAVAALTFAVIGLLAWMKGRLYCNTVCPVGTVLGYLNKFSLFKIRFDGDKCASCGVCEKKCKASCIDAKTMTIDYSRCVNCFNCINDCGKKAISFSAGKNREIGRRQRALDMRGTGQAGDDGRRTASVDAGKRGFLLTGISAVIAAPAIFAQAKAEALLSGRKERQTAISPPGAVSAGHLLKHCTSCHLCVSKCPTRVLKPAFMEYGVGGIMMPVMYFEKGFCNFDCTVCATVCPTGALRPLTVEQKHILQVGRVVFVPERCVVNTNGTSCGACSEHCPTQAVKMVAYKNGLTIPSVDAEICVGCGGCEYICPVRPYRAIYVEGNRIHQQARAFEVEKKMENEITDFGF